ncbi:DNA N-6-adenine-methyltransferase [Corynebacterium casei]|uniref:DNA N-6-adenine-methyltransferase n=1 Tax=Corynebacterium casei TaxID=160386 RepID=UPI003FD13308
MTAGRQSVSLTKDWCTPPSIIECVKSVFGGEIELDPCSNSWSLVNANREFMLPEHDGLKEPWDAGTIYVNPPYGSDPTRGTRIIHWFEKISEAVNKGSEVIALVPVATNTKHWKTYVYPKAAAICFLYQPRVKFFIEGREDTRGAPMSCAVLYYGPRWEAFAASFREQGAVISLADAVLPTPKLTLF